jgi:hypothetical protein
VDYAPTSPLGALIIAGVFVVLIVLQVLRPLRAVVAPPFRHLLVNLAIAVTAAVPVRLLVIPVGLITTAWAHQHRIGI